jgi:hypothetical protein
MSGPLSAVLMVVIPGALALTSAFILWRRGRRWLGTMAGFGLIAGAQGFLQVRLQLEVQACFERACRLIADPAACDAATFGCREWTGLTVLAYLIAGALDALILLAALAAAWLAARRRMRQTTPT